MADDKSLKKLHSIEKEILEHFVALCEKYHLTYYIIGGTLIGAVRHHGFIPWDDDIDIAMPRESYIRLINIMHHLDDSVLAMNYFEDDPTLYYYPIKIVHQQYFIKEARSKNGKAHPWIDILPLDGAPNSQIGMKIFKMKMFYYKSLLGLHYVNNLRDIKRSRSEKIMIAFGRITHIGKLINPTKVKRKIDRTLVSHPLKNSRLAGTCMGAYFFHEFVPQEYFGHGSKVIFENIEVSAPEQVDKYLTHMYGDYMKLPPVEKRVSHKVEFIDTND